MSKSNTSKKVVVTNVPPKAAPTVSKARTSSSAPVKSELVFGRSNYILIITGICLIGLGLLLMSGGAMPSPDVWDESIIYSKRRTLIAPMVIILGLVLEIFAIFRNSTTADNNQEGITR
jgi:uncharacterized membrane protein